ncbi:MAG TPA: lysozyme inhibitor LprI family protein [Candidatus Acidoferrum sp.]|nr:lysozyme inhibitor LprI family protein [Candidatus Acidoferrum sp.]
MLSLPPITYLLLGWRLPGTFVLAFALLALPSQICSQQTPGDGHEECARLGPIEDPPADLPSPEEKQELANCSSYNLYFGFGAPPDLAKARKCAYLERDQGKKLPETVFGGAGTLAMIYANGKGVGRNFGLALKFACEIDGAPAENSARIEHLQQLEKENWAGANFNLCDDATSGLMQGRCAKLQEDLHQVRRVKKLEGLTENWNPEERQAFTELQSAANAFFDSSSRNEVDLSGTGRAAFEIEAKAALKDGFLGALERFERGQLPKYRAADFVKADAQLNDLYKRIQSAPNQPIDFTTVTPEGIKSAQTAWLRYREAWVEFGKLKYPIVLPESWRAWLTQERVKMLQVWVPDGT